MAWGYVRRFQVSDCTRHGRPVSDYCGTAHYETSVARRGDKRLSMQNVVESDMSGVRLNQWCNLWCRFRFSSGERNTSVSLLLSKLRFTVRIYLVLFRSWSGAFLCHGMCMEESNLGPLFQSEARSRSFLIDVKAFRKLRGKLFPLSSVAEVIDRRSIVNKVMLYISKCSNETVIAHLFRASTSSNA